MLLKQFQIKNVQWTFVSELQAFEVLDNPTNAGLLILLVLENRSGYDSSYIIYCDS